MEPTIQFEEYLYLLRSLRYSGGNTYVQQLTTMIAAMIAMSRVPFYAPDLRMQPGQDLMTNPTIPGILTITRNTCIIYTQQWRNVIVE